MAFRLPRALSEGFHRRPEWASEGFRAVFGLGGGGSGLCAALAQAASGGAVPEAAVPGRALRFLFRGPVARASALRTH